MSWSMDSCRRRMMMMASSIDYKDDIEILCECKKVASLFTVERRETTDK